jgi:hypothetical protein
MLQRLGLVPQLEFRKLFCYILESHGAVAQLGERLTGSQKVVGSNPISSTNSYNPRKTDPEHLSSSPNSCTRLDIRLHRLIEGFLYLVK